MDRLRELKINLEKRSNHIALVLQTLQEVDSKFLEEKNEPHYCILCRGYQTYDQSFYVPCRIVDLVGPEYGVHLTHSIPFGNSFSFNSEEKYSPNGADWGSVALDWFFSFITNKVPVLSKIEENHYRITIEGVDDFFDLFCSEEEAEQALQGINDDFIF